MDDKYSNVLSACKLFENLSKNEIADILPAFNTNIREFLCGQTIINQGNKVTSFGIVLSGSVTALRYSLEGVASVIAKHSVGTVFGEILSCPSTAQSPVSVIAAESCTVLFIEYESFFSYDIARKRQIMTVLRNFTSLMSNQYFRLERKIRYLSIPSLRERITEYLYDNSIDGSVNSPFSRQELADYLCVNRSALSRELSRMKNEGIISVQKNKITLL